MCPSKYRAGDLVFISREALIYSGVVSFPPCLVENDSLSGIVLDIQNAREQMDLDNDDNLVACMLPTGDIEWIWEQDLSLIGR